MNHVMRLAAVCLSVVGAAAAAAQQPVTLTSTADFQLGNNEGLVSVAQDRVARDKITAGAVAPWAATTAVPTERGNVSSVAYNGFVYCIGGEGAADEVIYAPVNADGTLGAWSSTTALPSGRRFHTSVAYNGCVYVIAGYDADYGSAFGDVWVAPINGDGSIGNWTSTSSLPSARGFHASAVYNGFVYVTGGSEFGATPEVLFAPVNADGTLGSWTPTTELPANRDSHTCVAYNGFLYVLGGYQYLAGTTAFYAPINADGTVGAWTETSSLTVGHSTHASVAYNGFIYAIGGDWQVDVSVAAIDPNGSLGNWATIESLPAARRFLGAVTWNGYVYAIGGGAQELDVYYSSFNADSANANQAPDRLIGAYSRLVDLQSDTATRYVTLNGHLSPGGVIRLQVRVATDSDGIFGAETIIDPVVLGSPVEILGTGRYVWIRVTLDDSGTSDTNDPSYVTDVTVSATAPPTPGVVFDGPGADIDTQTSTSTLEANWSGFAAGVSDSIASYEWAIGTAPGLSNVQGWINVGLATSAINSSLSLSPGVKYVSVRAVSGLGLVSSPATSDGVQVQGPASTGGGGGSDHKSRCGQSASAAPGSWTGGLAGILLMAFALRRR
jgi:N-acetylneuraminic acid mutarotase